MTRSQIIIQQQLFLSYLPHVRAQFGMLPGVAVIGLGAKERNGEILDEWAFRFYVHQKLPLHEIPAAERIPDQIFGIQTDVISYFEKESLICDASVLSIDTNGYRDEGIRGGISIRNDHFDNDQPSGYGTLGVLARRKSDNALVGLTCAHVVNAASQNLTEINTKIGQPKYWVTCCCCPHGYIGDVAKATFNTDLDCAVIAIHDDIEEHVTANHTENKIEGLANDITGAAAIVCFDTVTKRGRATGLTAGKISEIAYGNNQMLIERTGGNAGDPFACHGDSGAVVVNSSGQVVGLVVAAARANMKRTIVTHIKPVMQELDITIAGTDASTIGEPLGGGPTGCELLIWPGGQADTAMNPVEKFSSSDFGLTGPVAWDVSTGAPGAVITETGTQQATNLESISVRYDRVSATKNATDTVYIQAKGTDTVTKFRTIFCFTPRAINTANPLDSNNSKLFPLTGGTQNLAGIATPVDAGDWFMAKAEIIYDINPQNIQWSGGNSVSFVTGAPGGLQGNIVARRETKFTKGEQANGAANRTHTDQATYITAGESSTDDFQPPTDALPNNLFRLANEGFDPANLLQGYLRADFRDYLEFHDGTNWVRITSYTEWFANLTGGLNTAPPPTATDPNTIGAGANTEKIPNQKPTVVPVEAFREIKPGEVLTMNVTVTDADNDEVTVTWAQTAGPAATLSSTTGTSVNFTAPAGDFQFKFSVTGKDKTEILSRNAGNFQSDAAEIIVNVIEWKNVGGGDPIPGRTITEVVTAGTFGIGAGALNWDVTTGGIAAVIIEADGAAIAPTGTVNGATNIKVRYDNRSGDLTRAQTVKIQATHPASGKVWFKRRTVFRVEVSVHATDTHTYLIPSTIIATGKDHFCTAQGQGNSILEAAITPAPVPADINWVGTGAFVFTVPGIGGDRATATISSNTVTGQDIPFSITIGGDTCYNGRYWTIWTSAPVVNLGPPPYFAFDPTSIFFSGPITFTYTIQPATIISATPAITDIPDLRGPNNDLGGAAVPPPRVPAGDVSVQNSGVHDLDGGATTKWDVSRQNKQKPINLQNIPDSIASSNAQGLGDLMLLYSNYPSDLLAGNDDRGVADEDDDPYVAGRAGVGKIFSSDAPGRQIFHSDGDVGDTFELRLHFREFARLLLDDTWYPISGFSLWKIHMRTIKRDEAADGVDYDNDGRRDKEMWADNGTVLEQNNNGF